MISRLLYRESMTDYSNPNDEDGIVWNDSEIDIVWPIVVKKYNESASINSYFLEDGETIIFSEKDKRCGNLSTAVFRRYRDG